MIMLFLYITMTSFFINVTIHPASHSSTMETSERLIFGKICACLALIVSIGKSNPPSIVDLIVCPLGNSALIIFVVGRSLFRWADTYMKLPVHPESANAIFPILFLFQSLLLEFERD